MKISELRCGSDRPYKKLQSIGIETIEQLLDLEFLEFANLPLSKKTMLRLFYGLTHLHEGKLLANAKKWEQYRIEKGYEDKFQKEKARKFDRIAEIIEPTLNKEILSKLKESK